MVALFVCPNDGMLECLKNLFGKDWSFYLKLLVTQKIFTSFQNKFEVNKCFGLKLN